MSLTLSSTVQELLDQFCVIDQEHTDQPPELTDFGQNGFQLNWSDGSRVRISLATMSMTRTGVRARETVDLSEVPGGFNPNNPLENGQGPLEGDIVPVDIPYTGSPTKNVALAEL